MGGVCRRSESGSGGSRGLGGRLSGGRERGRRGVGGAASVCFAFSGGSRNTMRLTVPSRDSSFLHSWLETEGALLQKISKLRVRPVT